MPEFKYCEFDMTAEELCFIDKYYGSLYQLYSSKEDCQRTDLQQQFHNLFDGPVGDIELKDCSNLQELSWFKFQRNLLANLWHGHDDKLRDSRLTSIFKGTDRPFCTRAFIARNRRLLDKTSSTIPFEPDDILFCTKHLRGQLLEPLSSMGEIHGALNDLAGDWTLSCGDDWGNMMYDVIPHVVDLWIESSGFKTAFFVDVVRNRVAL